MTEADQFIELLMKESPQRQIEAMREMARERFDGARAFRRECALEAMRFLLPDFRDALIHDSDWQTDAHNLAWVASAIGAEMALLEREIDRKIQKGKEEGK